MLTALLQADAAPSKASNLLITIHRCQGLVLQSAHNGHDKMPGIAAAVQRPYIHYTPPGRTVGHDSGVREGDAPIYNDAACWAYVRSKSFEQALHEQSLQVRLHCLLHIIGFTRVALSITSPDGSENMTSSGNTEQQAEMSMFFVA